VKKTGKIGRFVFTAFLFFLLSFFGCRKTPAQGIKIVATTTLIGTIVETIGKDKVNVITIVPEGMCPGHFDIKSSDLEILSGAKLLLNHGWEKWIENLINSVENKKLEVKTINLDGNWMIPDVHLQAIEEIEKVLCKTDTQNREWYQKSSNFYKEAINSETGQIRDLIKDLQGTKVICSKHQEGFLNWLGFKIIATYDRDEELTPKELVAIIKTAKKKEAQIVVDNLQSGAKAGVQISEEIGSKYVILTNFPHNNSYIESLKENINKIIRVMAE